MEISEQLLVLHWLFEVHHMTEWCHSEMLNAFYWALLCCETGVR